MQQFYKLFLVGFGALVMIGCKKEFNVAVHQGTLSKETIVSPQLNASASKAVLLQGNEKNTAVNFNWAAFQPEQVGAENYTLEADISGNQFADAIAIGNTMDKKMSFTVSEFNQQLRKISLPGNLTRFEFRIRLNRSNVAPVYSAGIAMEVSTYDNNKNFGSESIFRFPGNYQSWKVELAPRIVSMNGDSEYEGYINMTDPQPLFIMVRGATSWEFPYMYFDLGQGKFGPGNILFQLPGAGIYKFNLSTKTYKWSYTRIEKFSVHGNATGQSDIDMVFDNNTRTWTLTTDLAAGEFLFRANRSDKVKLGSDSEGPAGSLNSDGGSIQVRKPGKYKIILSVLEGGNYTYGIQRLPS